MVGLLDEYFQSSVVARVAQDFMFGSYLFSYIYINNLTINLESTAKLFVDDTSLFPTRYNPSVSAAESSSYEKKKKKKKSDWAYKWKMTFNQDQCKQEQEAIFSRKTVKINHSSITSNKYQLLALWKKLLGLNVDVQSSYQLKYAKSK